MSLLDALLLDPQRIDVWISKRPNDDSEGSGTQQDPWNGNTKTQFDAVMRSKVTPNMCVHIGPGTFDTDGYYEGMGPSEGWQMKPGVRMMGAGMGVTILKRVKALGAGALGYAVGHDLQVTSPSVAPGLVDFAEISEMTIDAGFADMSNANTTAGAVRLMGHHARVSRVRILNWGNKNSGIPGFGIGLLTANTNSGSVASDVSGVTNCGIDSCIASLPAANSTSPTVALQVGARENPGTAEGVGAAPYIRNSFVDGGSNPPAGLVALGMSWCREGVVEGNIVLSCPYAGPNVGIPHANLRGARSLTVRSNQFRGVTEGIRRDHPVDSDPVQLLAVEQTVFEVTPASTAVVWVRFPTTAGELRGDVRLVGNTFRKADQSGLSSAVELLGLRNLLVRENVLEAVLAVSPLSYDAASGGVVFFENRTLAGALVRGRNQTSGRHVDELSTQADDALLMTFLTPA